MMGGHGGEESINATEGVNLIMKELSPGEIGKAEFSYVREQTVEVGRTGIMLKGKGPSTGVEPSFRWVNEVPISCKERGVEWIGRGSSR